MGEPEWTMPMLEPFEWADSEYAREAPNQPPALDDVHEHSHVEHRIHQGLDVVHVASTVAEFYEMIHVSGAPLAASHGGAAAAAGVIAPLGAVATVVVTVMEVYKAFTTTQRIETQKGICFGLMWEVLGVPDVDQTTRPSPVGGGTIPLTESEHKAWEEGVREGREKAKDPEVREAITRALAYEMAAQGRDPDTDPQHHAWQQAVDHTLNRIWTDVHEDLGPLQGSQLDWKGTQDGFPTHRQ